MKSPVDRARCLVHKVLRSGIHRFWSTRHASLSHPQTLDVRARHEIPSALTELAGGSGRHDQPGTSPPAWPFRRGDYTSAPAGRWRLMAHGIYYTAGTQPTWDGLAWAGVLIGGDAARSVRKRRDSCIGSSTTRLDRSMCWCQWVGAHEWEANGTSAENVRVQGRRAPWAPPPRLTVEDASAGFVSAGRRSRSCRIHHQSSPGPEDDTSSVAGGSESRAAATRIANSSPTSWVTWQRAQSLRWR